VSEDERRDQQEEGQDEDVEAHKKHAGASDDAQDEGDDVEAHRQHGGVGRQHGGA
jgi:hypothetical protein